MVRTIGICPGRRTSEWECPLKLIASARRNFPPLFLKRDSDHDECSRKKTKEHGDGGRGEGVEEFGRIFLNM